MKGVTDHYDLSVKTIDNSKVLEVLRRGNQYFEDVEESGEKDFGVLILVIVLCVLAGVVGIIWKIKKRGNDDAP